MIHYYYKADLEKRAICLDYPENSPHVAGDAMHLPFRAESFDGLICNAVLEHLCEPSLAVSEVYRVLEPDSRAFFYVPWMYPYHEAPGDYWRFSRTAIAYLFRNFAEIEIIPQGQGNLTVVAGLLCRYRQPWYSRLASVAGIIQLFLMLLAKFLRRIPLLKGTAAIILSWDSADTAHGYFAWLVR